METSGEARNLKIQVIFCCRLVFGQSTAKNNLNFQGFLLEEIGLDSQKSVPMDLKSYKFPFSETHPWENEQLNDPKKHKRRHSVTDRMIKILWGDEGTIFPLARNYKKFGPIQSLENMRSCRVRMTRISKLPSPETKT